MPRRNGAPTHVSFTPTHKILPCEDVVTFYLKSNKQTKFVQNWKWNHSPWKHFPLPNHFPGEGPTACNVRHHFRANKKSQWGNTHWPTKKALAEASFLPAALILEIFEEGKSSTFFDSGTALVTRETWCETKALLANNTFRVSIARTSVVIFACSTRLVTQPFEPYSQPQALHLSQVICASQSKLQKWKQPIFHRRNLLVINQVSTKKISVDKERRFARKPLSVRGKA